LDVFVFESVADRRLFAKIHKLLIFGRLRLEKGGSLLLLQEGVW